MGLLYTGTIMSLIRRQTTEAMAAANRANSQASTGPVTPGGKLRARMSALQHGLWAEVPQAVLQLGEKEEDRLELQRQHERQFRPNSPIETALVEQMAENRWRRRRTLRGERSMLVARLTQFDVEHGQALAAEGRSPFSTGEARLAEKSGLASLPDSSHKFHFILECLQTARRVLETEGFCEAGLKRLEAVYGPDPGLAGAALLASYRGCQKGAPDAFSPAHPEARANQTDFLALLDCEISAFQTLQELDEISQTELVAAERETLIMLPGKHQTRILRYEGFLDRQYERLLEQFEDYRDRKAAVLEKRHQHLNVMGRGSARESSSWQDAQNEK